VSITPGSKFLGRQRTFRPGWCYQSGLKVLQRVNSNGKRPIQSHMCCVGGVECYVKAMHEVLGLNPTQGLEVEGIIFFIHGGPLVRVQGNWD
jgi:hypothetical protein